MTPRVELVCADAVEFLRGFSFDGSELVYADPPYMLSTRAGGRQYEHEMTDSQHRKLLDVLRRLPCFVMLSGYASSLYREKLKGWNAIKYRVMTRGGRPAVEYCWFNFPEPLQLHDYSWLGENFRERERIARQRRRWVLRLARMPRLQRLALQSAIAIVGGSTRSGGNDAVS